MIEAVVEDIMLEDGKAWKHGNRVLVSVITGPETSLNDFHEILEKLRAKLPVDLPISAGAAIHPEKSETLSMTLLVTRRSEESVMPKARVEPKKEVEAPAEVKEKMSRRRKFIASQKEFEFDKNTGRFAQSTPTVRGNEDLDRPTFQRKGIVLRG